MKIESDINLSNKQITSSVLNSVIISFSELSIFTLILAISFIFLIIAIIFRHIRTGRTQVSLAKQIRILQDLYSAHNQRYGPPNPTPPQ